MPDEYQKDALITLRADLAEALLIAGIVGDLRKNTDALLIPLAQELRRVRGTIDEVLRMLPHND
jgi:hypothetical protein